MTDNLQQSTIATDHRQVRQFQRLFVHLCHAAQGAYDHEGKLQKTQKYQRLSTALNSPLLQQQSKPLLPLSSTSAPLLSFRPAVFEGKEARDAAVAAAVQQYQQIKEKKLAQVEYELKVIEARYQELSRKPTIDRAQLQKVDGMLVSLRQMIQRMKKKENE